MASASSVKGLQTLSNEKVVLPPGSIVSNHGIRKYYTVTGQEDPGSVAKQDAGDQQEKSSTEMDVGRSYRHMQTSPIQFPEPTDTRVNKDVQTSYLRLPNDSDDQPVNVANGYTQTTPALAEHIAFPREAVSARSFGNRSVYTEDYYNALSRHSDDPVIEPPLERSMSIVVPPTTGNRTPPTPFPLGNKVVGLKESSRQFLSHKDAAANTSPVYPPYNLPTISKSTQINEAGSIFRHVVSQ